MFVFITYKVESSVMYLLAICISFLVQFWFASFTTFLWVVVTLFLLACKTTIRTLTIVFSYLPYLLWFVQVDFFFCFYFCLQHVWLSLVDKSGNPKCIGSILGFCILSCSSVSQSKNRYLWKYTYLWKVNFVHMWLIHIDVWQKPLQYCKVISLQLKLIN